MKHCSKCGELKDNSEYYIRRRNNRETLEAQCKACCAITQKLWRQNNREKAAANRRLYKKRHPDKVAEQKRRAYLRDPMKHIERSRAYREKNPDAGREWKQANILKVRESTNRRRKAILENGRYEITEKFLRRLYESPCAFCGSRNRIEMDHVIPVSRGGYHGEGNLQPLCKACNAAKRDKLMIEFKIYLRLLK